MSSDSVNADVNTTASSYAAPRCFGKQREMAGVSEQTSELPAGKRAGVPLEERARASSKPRPRPLYSPYGETHKLKASATNASGRVGRAHGSLRFLYVPATEPAEARC
jgi:hypothetical protein